MRRNYISPEFVYEKVHGTFNMKEQSSFFGSKMLSIENSITIGNESIVYYQNENGEQIDLESERFFPSRIFNTVDEKSKTHVLFLDDSQSEYQKNGYTRWILDIQMKTVLNGYLSAVLKKWRTFEGVGNSMTLNNNVSAAVSEYVVTNLLGRYRFSKIEFYIKSVDLKTSNALQFSNTFDSSIESPDCLFSKLEVQSDPQESNLRVKFAQPDQSSQYNFKYYYNLFFEKI